MPAAPCRPCVTLPPQSSPAVPDQNGTRQSSPAESRPDMPGLGATWYAEPDQASQAEPYNPGRTSPCHACLALPCLAIPRYACQTSPGLAWERPSLPAVPTGPRLGQPRLGTPVHACRAEPKLAWPPPDMPCLPCHCLPNRSMPDPSMPAALNRDVQNNALNSPACLAPPLQASNSLSNDPRCQPCPAKVCPYTHFPACQATFCRRWP